jgi:hypothetical protein
LTGDPLGDPETVMRRFVPFVFLAFAGVALADQRGVFLDGGRESVAVATDEPTVIRRRIATLDAGALRDSALLREPATLDLFPDAAFTVEGGRIEAIDEARWNWTADLRDQQGGRGTLSLVGRSGRCAGIVTGADGRVFTFCHTDDGDLRIEERDPIGAPSCAFDPARHAPAPIPGESAPPATNATARSEPPVADVLLLYTPAARATAGGHQAIRLEIELAVYDTNVALADSGANLRIRAAHVRETDYTETGAFGTDLDRLRINGDGYMDEAHSLRDAYGADFVALINVVGDACGVGYLMTGQGWLFAPWAFTVNARQCFFIQVLAHELGHNAGCHHDRDNAGGGQGAAPYAYGYRTPSSKAGQFKTVMAYDPGTTVRLFSNPDAEWNGLPMGVSADQPDSAHNARSVTEQAAAIAAWRPETTVIPGDLDFNGAVDGADLGRFLGAWGDPGSGADFTGDGAVDGADLGTLLANWTG